MDSDFLNHLDCSRQYLLHDKHYSQINEYHRKDVCHVTKVECVRAASAANNTLSTESCRLRRFNPEPHRDTGAQGGPFRLNQDIIQQYRKCVRMGTSRAPVGYTVIEVGGGPKRRRK